ncbi:hypothetical protein NL676_021433 [Syzygium grande]|nr:hypothetical protein NL676_021433 [Syzygium grande]
MDIAKVREAASAHYEGLVEDQKQMAQSYFAHMDTNRSGNISIDEFVTYLSTVGSQSNYHYWLFAQLDKDNNSTLNFKELVTFFYMLNREIRPSLESGS